MRFNIVGDKQKAHVMEIVRNLDISQRMVVEITKPKDRRSLAQNSLYWVWVTFLAGEQGLTKDEVHEDLKTRILSRIYQRDLEWFAELLESIREVWRQGMKDLATEMHRRVMKMVSTREASIEQFSEYLDDIEKDAANRGITLPHPEDSYYDAMGM